MFKEAFTTETYVYNQRYLASVVLELGLLVGVLATNLFVEWESWARFGASQVVALHVVSLSVTIWMREADRNRAIEPPGRKTLFLPLLALRGLTALVDVMALVRSSVAIGRERTADDAYKLTLLATLFLLALFRVYETRRWVQEAVTEYESVSQ